MVKTGVSRHFPENAWKVIFGMVIGSGSGFGAGADDFQ